MNINKKHVKAASMGLRETYSSVFRPSALHHLTANRRQIHSARAQIICGNIFTLGLANLFFLYRGARRNRDAEVTQIHIEKVASYAQQNHQRFGLDEQWFRQRLWFDLELAESGPSDDPAMELNYVLLFLNSIEANGPDFLSKATSKNNMPL